MGHRTERISIWVASLIGGVSLLAGAVVMPKDTSPALLGVLYVLGTLFLVIGLVGVAYEIVGAVRGRLPDSSPRNEPKPQRLLAAKDATRRPQSAEALIAALQTGDTATLVMPRPAGPEGSSQVRNGMLAGGLIVALVIAAVVVVQTGVLGGSKARPSASDNAGGPTSGATATATTANGGSTYSATGTDQGQLGTPTQVPAPTPAVPTSTPIPATTPRPLPYLADFSQGLNPSGWTGTADWDVKDGALASNGTGDKRMPSAKAPILPSTADYAVEAEIQVTEGCGSFGVIARSDDGGGGYALGYRCSSQSLELGTPHGWYGGCSYQSDCPPYRNAPFTPKGTFKLRLEVRLNHITAFIDGQQQFSYLDQQYLDPGNVGIWSDHTALKIPSFTVTALA